MKFPKRTPQHISETASWKILVDKTPESWLLRDVNERDYGIDAYIELVNPDGDVRGDLCSVQLKGAEKIKWRKKTKDATFLIEPATVNYWMNLAIPVFLVLTDNTTRQAFFASVQFQVRKSYESYVKEEPFTFIIKPENELGTEVGDMLFIAYYLQQRRFPLFHSAVRMLMLHHRQYLDFIEGNQGLDQFLGVEPDDFVLFLHIWQTCVLLGGYLMIDMKLPDLAKALKDDAETWKEPFYSIHNYTLDMLLKSLEPHFLETLDKSHKRIVETDAGYWRHADYPLHSFCELIRPDSWRRQL